jgi:hypothetical protein
MSELLVERLRMAVTLGPTQVFVGVILVALRLSIRRPSWWP